MVCPCHSVFTARERAAVWYWDDLWISTGWHDMHADKFGLICTQLRQEVAMPAHESTNIKMTAEHGSGGAVCSWTSWNYRLCTFRTGWDHIGTDWTVISQTSILWHHQWHVKHLQFQNNFTSRHWHLFFSLLLSQLTFPPPGSCCSLFREPHLAWTWL